jgi:uncharacterized GH25 family protein
MFSRLASWAFRAHRALAGGPPRSALAPAAVAAGLLFSARPALAHDYWMVPAPLVTPAAQEVTLSLFVGEDFVAQDEKRFETARASRFSHLHGSETAEVLSLSAEGGAPILRLRVEGEGGHLFVLDRNLAKIELAPAKFEDYLRHEGLTAVLAERARRGESDKPGRERYTRCLKALVQVGAARDGTFGRVAGQALEIVPESDPGLAAPGDSLAVRVLFRGTPLQGARVEAFSREGADVKGQESATDEHGIAHVAVDRRGAWLLRMVHMVRCEGCADADWESTWASYVFASRPADGGTFAAPPMMAPGSSTGSGGVRRWGPIAAGALLFGLGALLSILRRRRR